MTCMLPSKKWPFKITMAREIWISLLALPLYYRKRLKIYH
jgi:hypothetical protein